MTMSDVLAHYKERPQEYEAFYLSHTQDNIIRIIFSETVFTSTVLQFKFKNYDTNLGLVYIMFGAKHNVRLVL